VLGLASVGLPGTLAFVAEDLVFHATLEARPWTGVAVIAATALNGISVLRIAFRLFGGRTRRTGEGDLTGRERLVLGALGAFLFALGLAPHPILAPAYDALEHLELQGLEPRGLDPRGLEPRAPSPAGVHHEPPPARSS
jgi:NADH:ubiquinone oxidoreductase subunit 4 (subunit M)